MNLTKICSVCHTRKGLSYFHASGRKRKTDGIMPLRAACIVCERSKARERHERIRINRAIRKCPTCDNAMAANGCGSRAGLRQNRARLHSDELLRVILNLKAAVEYFPDPPSPLLLSVDSQATAVLNKVMGRRWREREKERNDENFR